MADAHNDVLLRSMIGQDILSEHPDSHSDLIKFQEGGMDLQVFSIWVSPYEYEKNEAFDRANDMITQLEDLCNRSNGQWAIPMNYQDIVYNEQRGILSCLIGVEGGHAIENDLAKLDALYNRGMRYLSVTWNNSNDWATSAKDETEKKDSLAFVGLTDFGKDVIRRCNELGIMVDVSHAGEQTFWDIINVSEKPIIASHSSAYYLCPHFRNLKDEQLFAIKDNGGVVFVNFYPGYIDSTYEKKAKIIKESYQSRLDSLAAVHDSDGDEYWYEENKLLLPALQKVAPSLDVLIDHISYLVLLMGIDHVGLGADWDGVGVMPTGLEDVTKLPAITDKLLKRGLTKKEVQKILGGNFKRVFKEVSQ
ncbi:MAG: dipeptidase [Candidatus Marinimicrobia bacterium]|nr:dipeptidase [Candidatus Neomarinimicrobiota bacterium]MCH7764162.1 dipeptidase [Candidatus Neomarinimicrobiota bacterium]